MVVSEHTPAVEQHALSSAGQGLLGEHVEPTGGWKVLVPVHADWIVIVHPPLAEQHAPPPHGLFGVQEEVPAPR